MQVFFDSFAMKLKDIALVPYLVQILQLKSSGLYWLSLAKNIHTFVGLLPAKVQTYMENGLSGEGRSK